MENRPATLRSRRVCRFCLTESEPLSYIYDREMSRSFLVPLTLQIMSCVGIEVYAADGMPQMICNTCRWNLDRSYKFKQQCKKADEALRAYPVSGVLPRPFPPISTEPPDTNNKRSAEQRAHNEQQKKARLDNGDRERRERQAEKQSKEERIDIYDEDQDRGSEGENEAGNEKEDRKLEPGEVRVHSCTLCERTFPLRQALLLHIQRAHRDRNYKCTECDRMFFSKYDLNKHILTHSEDKPYTCQICNKQFARANLLQRHEKVHRDELRYGCQHCDREFFTTDELEKHEESAHKANKPFQCNICNKRFTYKQGLERHEMLHSEDKTFVCEYCKEAFRTSTKLARHLSTHAGHRPYLCKLCPRTFLLSHHLTRHMRSHSVEKRHVCEDCGKAFKRKESLEVHQLTHTKRSGLGLTCDVCQDTCRNRADYVTHIKQHIEAGEKMGPDGLQPDIKEKIEIDSEDEEDEEQYSDGDDDYEPPPYIVKKIPKIKTVESEEEADRMDKEMRDEKVVYVRGKDGTMVKKTIKTLMPIQRREATEIVKSPTQKTPMKQEDIPKGRVDETEAQVQKIVESVFKEHKIPLKHQTTPEPSKNVQTPQKITTSPKEEKLEQKPMNTVKVIKRIVVRKPVGSGETIAKDCDLPGISQSVQSPASGVKVTKRVIVRRIIRQGDTTREVIMNPDGTIIDPSELAKLPTGNVVKRVVMKKPLDKSQNLIQSMMQSPEIVRPQPKLTESTDPLKFELKTTQGPGATIVKVDETSTKDQETKEKLEQLEKRVEQQRLKIEELQARKQQEYEPADEMLPERHDESEDEQQLPLKRVFVKRKQSIYDEEQEYDETKVAKEELQSTESFEVETPKQSNKPSITSSKVYGNKKIILLKPEEQPATDPDPEDAEISQMNQELSNILDSTDSIVKMQATTLSQLTEISSISVSEANQKIYMESVEKEEAVEQMEQEPVEEVVGAVSEVGEVGEVGEIPEVGQVTEEQSEGVNNENIISEAVPEEEKMEIEQQEQEEEQQETVQNDENIEQVQETTLSLSGHEISASEDMFEQSGSVLESQKSDNTPLEDSVIELSQTNDTITLNDTHDSRDSLEDKLSQMEG
ncbi:uncharacterized protein LOC122502039 isoform X2 [Leptopilina heterotoma]|uniref:uncharacterized protein LOC122502039 isoform X2 n=1 Tax=Leptopilina heterotoma TaxID=63436 RepID=UPI001CAA05FA|nr:uncharacterized protein LOC122502039 isoform X2 [Leptopilina heterotoma]